MTLYQQFESEQRTKRALRAVNRPLRRARLWQLGLLLLLAAGLLAVLAGSR